MNAIANPANGLIIYCTDCSNSGNGALAMFISGAWYMFSPTCIVPLAPLSGIHAPTSTQITWNWNSVSDATGYKWNKTNSQDSAIDMGTSTTKTETSLSCNTAYTRYIWAYNSCGNSAVTTMTQSTSMNPAVSVSISASINPICADTSVTFTATTTNGGTSPLYQWKKNGAIIAGDTTTTYTYIPVDNDSIICQLTSNTACSQNNPATSNLITMTINPTPSAPASGTNTSTQTQILWNWNSINCATGYKLNTTNDYATATDMSTATTKTETLLTCNTAYTRYIWAYNGCGNSLVTILTYATSSCGTFACGQNIAINHIADSVAPVTKTTIYSTVTNIPGETSKCWITSNLGSDHQATIVSDATEPSAGWYWQFNCKQGYKHDGTSVTPSWTITSIDESSVWVAANDPCNIEIGNPWRIPTYAEWYNVSSIGGWINWNSTFGSMLKLHAAGSLKYINGWLHDRGSYGEYWSSSQDISTYGGMMSFGSSYCNMVQYGKAYGFSIRCLRESCSTAPSSPTSGSHTPSTTQIIWNWGTVTGAIGYTWNTTNDYTTSINMDTATTKIESGLTCNTSYTRYVWAYNSCGYSVAIALTQTTSACPGFICGQPITDSRDGKIYNTVMIGNQCWMAQNLNIGTLVNNSVNQANNSVIEKYCYHDSTARCDVYGGLYQ